MENSPQDIIGITQELMKESCGCGDCLDCARILEHFPAIAEALMIAVDVLEDSANMPEYDQDDAHRLRHKARQSLSRISSLPSNGK